MQNDENDDEEDEGALVGDAPGFTLDVECENPTDEAFEIKQDQAGPAMESAETHPRVQYAKAVAGRSPATQSMKRSKSHAHIDDSASVVSGGRSSVRGGEKVKGHGVRYYIDQLYLAEVVSGNKRGVLEHHARELLKKRQTRMRRPHCDFIWSSSKKLASCHLAQSRTLLCQRCHNACKT